MPAIVDQIIRSNRKTIAILVQRDGKVIVRAPLRTSERVINAFIDSKRDWIKEKKTLADQQGKIPEKKYANGEKFWLLGKQITLRIVEDQKLGLDLRDEFLLSKKAQNQALAYFERWYKIKAYKVLNERVLFFAKMHGFRNGMIRISSARTRWGSCSSQGTLSFTWRLIMAPIEVVDYVVIHELVHLKIKNHSAVFWNEVARLMPDYKTKREWLKKNGHILTLGGEQ